MSNPLPPGVPQLGSYVRVHLNYGGVLAEGEVIGFYDHPTYIVRTAGGTQVACSSTLRHEPIPKPIRKPQTEDEHWEDFMTNWGDETGVT